MNWLILSLVLTCFIGTIRMEREHKVHNIILYPERHSWCQTQPIRQVVALAGYEPITIDNNICVGACYSYSIPSTQPAEPGELMRPYCDSCQPVDTKCYHVTLHADELNTDGPKTFQKRVQIIMNCSCLSCNKVKNVEDNCNIESNQIVELPSDLFANRTQPSTSGGQSPANTKLITDDIPELLDFIPDKNRTLLNINNKFKYETNFTQQTNDRQFDLNENLLKFLKYLQESSELNEDQFNNEEINAKLKNLVNLIENNEGELSDKNLMEFVNYVNTHNSDDLELDLMKLKEILLKFKKNAKFLDKFNLISVKNNEKIMDDLNRLKLPINYGVEGQIPSALPVKMNLISDNDDDENEETTTTVQTTTTSEKVHHHLGEQVQLVHGLNVGHLIKGPHGSMVLAKVEEKFNIDSDGLKPNHDGIVIAYENPNNKKVD